MLSLNSLKKLYHDSPLWIKNIYASIPCEIRNGKEYRKYRKFLEKNIDIEAYEIMKLKETLTYAYNNTTYYKKMFDSLNLSAININSRMDLENIPCITKDDVRENFRDLCVENYAKSDTFYVTTGGSSGDPMKFLQSTNIWKKELAYDAFYLENYGYFQMDSRASFRGGEFNIIDNIFWTTNPMYNEVHFSPYHLSLLTIEYYANKLNEIHAKMYLSYPSSLLLLIDCLNTKNIVLNNHPKLILLISENINSFEVKKIATYFKNTKVISLYGHSERLIFGTSSTYLLDEYIIDRRYGLFELVDNQNKNIKDNNIKGEIVGTSFENWAMPLIRYNTGDYTDYIDKDTYKISAIDGRWKQEYLEGYNGSKIFLTALNMHSDVFQHVRQFQFMQYEVGKAELLVVAENDFTLKDKQAILQALKNKVAQNIEFTLKYVDKLELTSRGKIIRIIKRM